MNRVLVTGAGGFVGSALCHRLRAEGMNVRRGLRDRTNILSDGGSDSGRFDSVVLHDHSTSTEIQQALDEVQAVIHLAARVHVMRDHVADPLQEFRRVNREWTERLAREAAKQGVRRFVYVSSIKVNGEESVVPFTEEDAPNPQDPYGVSKWEAEQALTAVSTDTGLETVVIRPPLVYGPRVGGNFLQLLKVLQTGVPLPLALVENRRSLIFLENLVDALFRCVQDRRAMGRTYLISDGEDLSTPELIRRTGKALGVLPRLWPMPIVLLGWMGRIMKKEDMIERLTGSLQVNSSRIRRELDWQPGYSVDQGLAETCSWFNGTVSQAAPAA